MHYHNAFVLSAWNNEELWTTLGQIPAPLHSGNKLRPRVFFWGYGRRDPSPHAIPCQQTSARVASMTLVSLLQGGAGRRVRWINLAEDLPLFPKSPLCNGTETALPHKLCKSCSTHCSVWHDLCYMRDPHRCNGGNCVWTASLSMPGTSGKFKWALSHILQDLQALAATWWNLLTSYLLDNVPKVGSLMNNEVLYPYLISLRATSFLRATVSFLF